MQTVDARITGEEGVEDRSEKEHLRFAAKLAFVNRQGDAAHPGQDVLTRMIYNEFKLRLPELLLMRVDKIGMSTSIEARVLVTERVPPLRVRGHTVHQVGLPYHWGTRGLTTGDAANDLFPLALDPNVHIQEVKAATCDIRPGRRPRGPGPAS